VDWGALGKAIVARRIELGWNTRDELAEASGIGARTLGDLETGRKDGYYPATLARLERGLRWPAGTVDAILSGDPPPTDRRPLLPPIDPGVPLPPPLPELIRMLQPDSPVPAEERAQLVALIDAVMEKARRYMAGYRLGG
jgi:transcriptional regulator with XRE-family HTH domain